MRAIKFKFVVSSKFKFIGRVQVQSSSLSESSNSKLKFMGGGTREGMLLILVVIGVQGGTREAEGVLPEGCQQRHPLAVGDRC